MLQIFTVNHEYKFNKSSPTQIWLFSIYLNSLYIPMIKNEDYD